MTKHCPLRYLLPKSTHMHFSSGFYLSPKSGNFSKEKHLVTLLAPLTSASLRPCPCAEGYPSCYPHGTTRDDIAGRVARLHQRLGSSVVCALGSLCGVRLSQVRPGQDVQCGVHKSRACVRCCQRVGLSPRRVSNKELSETPQYSEKKSVMRTERKDFQTGSGPKGRGAGPSDKASGDFTRCRGRSLFLEEWLL